MSDGYLALYRRHRPRRFDEVVGQGAVVDALKQSLAQGRFAHAYLFCGPRGTGKTSTARLLARAVNCTALDAGEPCESCPTCEAFLAGRLVDVHEIDAASNRRIAEMRDLLEQVSYTPTVGRYKVYILDEAHMLTTEAANAFLKTLEEPPPHALFVLATTEAHKILPTISSRCQVFEFRKIGEAACAELVQKVAEAEGASLGEGVARFVALRSGGAMRDALALLERLVATSEGRTVDRAAAVEALGLVPEDLLVRLATAILSRRPEAVYDVVDEVNRQGRDSRRLLLDLVGLVRDLLRARCDAADALSAYSPEAAATLQELARDQQVPRLLSVLARLDRGLVEARGALLPDFAVELTLLEALHLDVLYDRSQLERRLAVLEEAGGAPPRAPSPSVAAAPQPVAEVSAEPPSVPPTAPGSQDPPRRSSPAEEFLKLARAKQAREEEAREAAPAPAPAPAPEAAPAPDPDPDPVPPESVAPQGPAAHTERLRKTWGDVLERARREHPITYGFLREASLEPDTDGAVRVVVPEVYAFHHGKLSEPKHHAIVGSLLADALGGDVSWELALAAGGGGGGPTGKPPGPSSGGRRGGSSGESGTSRAKGSGQSKDWYEEKALAHPRVQEVVDTFDGQVLGVD